MNTVKLVRRSSAWPVALAALACLVGSAQVLASSQQIEIHSVTVRYGDLDLTSSAGAAALYGRIETAARMTCGHADHRLATLPYVNRCNSSAISTAVASVNSPLLTAIHAAHRGSSLTAMLNE